MNNDNIIYFELNNWACGINYPNDEPFISWMGNDLNIQFENENWVKENKLCVVTHMVDMSQNFLITTTKEWVNENCPKLLTDYNTFLRMPDKYGDVEGRFGHFFLKYDENNIGIKWEDDD